MDLNSPASYCIKDEEDARAQVVEMALTITTIRHALSSQYKVAEVRIPFISPSLPVS